MSGQPALTIFSLHLQWASPEKAVEIAAQAGFDGLAWAVRESAHIAPGDVARDLPVAVGRTREAGLATPEIVTAIGDATSPGAEAILSVAADLGIRHYRASAMRYDYARPIQPQLDEQRRRLERLSVLNARLGMTAMFHTQSYHNAIGGTVWDMWQLLRDLDPAHVGINFDIGHVMAKTGAGWKEAARVARSHIHALSTKDFVWARHEDALDDEWPWYTKFVAPGRGMVDFTGAFSWFRESGFDGPIIPYFEYLADIPGAVLPFDMNGGPYGRWRLPMPEERFVAFLERDLAFHRAALRRAGFAPSRA